MTLNIINDDISWAESILIKGKRFDEERKAVIRCLETKDILACPGSGKTTALLAKLLILSREMPLENNKGICVLTHTNVAINEIKSKALIASQKLYNYPNFFGTIQSFVNKYLAIPAYINKFDKRPNYIDNDIFYSVIEKSYETLHGAGKWLNNKREGGIEYLKKLRFSKDNFCISEKIDGQEFINNTCPTYKEINNLKLRILEWGYLCFEDAYSLAFVYLKKYPEISKLISKRFAYIFIDEMQDSSTIQSEILNNIFIESVVIQKTGDLNQSIFDYDADLNCGWVVNQEKSLQLTGSKRFTNSIATKVENFGVHKQTITGVEREDEISPVIIVYDNNTIQQVLDKFGEIIIKNNLHGLSNKIFKAVGWRGKPHEMKITIPSYWNCYSKEIKTKSTEFNNLINYLVSQDDHFISSNGANFYKKRITEALLKCLRIAGKTNGGRIFTEGKFNSYILENNPDFYRAFRLKLANWCLKIHEGKSVFEEVKKYINNEFRRFFNYEMNKDLTDFINISDLKAKEDEALESNNVYSYNDGTNKIDIEVSTIHGVKGETHTATCYLETFFYDYDIKRIIEYVKGNYTQPSQARIKQSLKMAFVGMSRPSHLLCVAAHINSISGHEDDLIKNEWTLNKDLISISET